MPNAEDESRNKERVELNVVIFDESKGLYKEVNTGIILCIDVNCWCSLRHWHRNQGTWTNGNLPL